MNNHTFCQHINVVLYYIGCSLFKIKNILNSETHLAPRILDKGFWMWWNHFHSQTCNIISLLTPHHIRQLKFLFAFDDLRIFLFRDRVLRREVEILRIYFCLFPYRSQMRFELVYWEGYEPEVEKNLFFSPELLRIWAKADFFNDPCNKVWYRPEEQSSILITFPFCVALWKLLCWKHKETRFLM